ncbi:hypothetical protein [Streptacidiphilus sp. PAMC 29251]
MRRKEEAPKEPLHPRHTKDASPYELAKGMRYQAFATNTRRGQAQFLDAQHRNKIAHQAALIESAHGSDPADVPSRAPARATGRRILLIASGGAADLRRADPALLHPAAPPRRRNRRRTGHHRRCHWPDAVRDGAAR